jgi:hypothetical protein
MSEILQCRKTETNEMLNKITEFRDQQRFKKNPNAAVIKKIDVVEEIILKGFEHPTLQKEIKEVKRTYGLV